MTATLVASALTHVGNVREHNEDAHWGDAAQAIFVVCDGMGGHAAGEVASALAVQTAQAHWTSPPTDDALRRWRDDRGIDARRGAIAAIKAGVVAAHRAICAEARADIAKRGMGTTFTGIAIAGGEAIVAHAGDSRAYLVRGGETLQLTEDHTLIARLIAAGVANEGDAEHPRWKGVITNALGFGDDTRIAMLAVSLADGDRLLLCSDGVSEYLGPAEIGDVVASAEPALACEALIQRALARGGADNATAVVVAVVDAGADAAPVATRKRDARSLARCPLLERLSPQQRLRVLRIAAEQRMAAGEGLPVGEGGERHAWIVLEGEVMVDGRIESAGALLYGESLLSNPGDPVPSAAHAINTVRALALRARHFLELTIEEPDLAEPLFAALARLRVTSVAADDER